MPWIKSKTDAQQQANLMALVKVAVYAAEQLYGAGHGADKLAYARDWLAQKGYAVDLAAIEAAVRELNSTKGDS